METAARSSSARSLQQPPSHTPSFGRIDSLVLPKLSWAAFAGDLQGVRRCLHEGEDIHQTVQLVNQNKELVLGITPLYLAAQGGHRDVCRELLRAGADVARTCTIPSTGQKFGPADIALAHFHLRTWWMLNEAKTTRLTRRRPSRREMMKGSALVQPLMEEGRELDCGGNLAI